MAPVGYPTVLRWRQSCCCVSPAEEATANDCAFLELKRRTQVVVAINRAQREISLLREYRTRLIADVVTGKLGRA